MDGVISRLLLLLARKFTSMVKFRKAHHRIHLQLFWPVFTKAQDLGKHFSP
jgi:hypothetical protein